MKWRCGLIFLSILPFAVAAAEEKPAVPQSESSTLTRWWQPAYDVLLKSYTEVQKKTNDYSKTQRYRVYDVAEEDKVFVDGTWQHPNYDRIRKKDNQSKRKASSSPRARASGLSKGGVLAADAVSEIVSNIDIADEDESMKEEGAHASRPKHKVGRNPGQ